MPRRFGENYGVRRLCGLASHAADQQFGIRMRASPLVESFTGKESSRGMNLNPTSSTPSGEPGPQGKIRVLNLGCGLVKREFPEAPRASEVIGIDISRQSNADLHHDLNQFPYPLDTDSFDLIIMQDILEHLDDVPRVMREVHRIARDGALVRIRTPHYSSHYAYNDPTHRQLFGALVLDGFDASRPNSLYGGPWFHFVKRQILFPRIWRMTGVAALANWFPARWEQLFAFIFRAENLLFELRAVKQDERVASADRQ